MWIIDDYIQARAAQNAADEQRKTAQEAMQLQERMYNQSRQDQTPWMDAGREGLGGLMSRMKMGDFDTAYDPNNVQLDPGFNFRMSEGQKALERSAAAKGGLRGGAFQKGLARYSQGLASQEYGNAFGRNLQNFGAQQSENQNRYGRYYNVAAMGQNAASGLGTLGTNFANSASNLYGNIGNANAAGQVAMGQGIGGGIRGFANLTMLGAGGGGGAAAVGSGATSGNGIPPQSGGRY